MTPLETVLNEWKDDTHRAIAVFSQERMNLLCKLIGRSQIEADKVSLETWHFLINEAIDRSKKGAPTNGVVVNITDRRK